MHTYLVIIDFLVKTLGIRDIELKKKNTNTTSKLVHTYTNTHKHSPEKHSLPLSTYLPWPHRNINLE